MGRSLLGSGIILFRIIRDMSNSIPPKRAVKLHTLLIF